MKRAMYFVSAVLCFSLAAVSRAAAQVQYNEGPVERVVLIHILPGHFSAFMDDLKKNVVPIWDAEKASGLIQSYEMFLCTTSSSDDDRDLGFSLIKTWLRSMALPTRSMTCA